MQIHTNLGGKITPISLGRLKITQPRPSPHLNQLKPPNQPRKPTLKENLNTFIRFCMENHERDDKRLDSLEASMKMVEMQVGKLAK